MLLLLLLLQLYTAASVSLAGCAVSYTRFELLTGRPCGSIRSWPVPVVLWRRLAIRWHAVVNPSLAVSAPASDVIACDITPTGKAVKHLYACLQTPLRKMSSCRACSAISGVSVCLYYVGNTSKLTDRDQLPCHSFQGNTPSDCFKRDWGGQNSKNSRFSTRHVVTLED